MPSLQPLPDLRRTPGWILPLQSNDQLPDRLRELVRTPLRATTAVRQPLQPTPFVAVVDLVAGLAGNPEFGAERRHLLAVEQPGHEPEALVHDVTLLPGHAPSLAKRARV